ncbi:uncharacterized protein LOC127547012 [Antechinus flavipes]|uniref:uncharacterized protein LOC127547012 n=1 Tax=Antechinus flavipes TaxID=38775 RepID=UPI002235D5F5|nr:uncharacterized protein LOC127547012 [Antechinus flavipes]XP_051829831.1 uncharacterized protein LOC127547012 [Antechinus flavipes]
MHKIWGLVLFYGLLIQSSAHKRRQKLILTQPLAKASVQAEVSAWAEVSPSLLLEVATSLHSKLLNTNTLNNLKKLPFMEALHLIQGGLLGSLHAGVDAKFLGLEISSIEIIEAQIFNINITQNEEKRQQLLATFPVTLDMEANIFSLGNIGFKIEMNNRFQIGTEMDENEDGYLVIQGCNSDFVSLKVKTHISLLNAMLNAFSKVLNAVVPQLVQEALCSAVSTCLLKLDVKLKTALVDALICGNNLNVN